MKIMSHFEFDKELNTIGEAVDLIVKVVFPELPKRNAKRRIHSKINQARKNNELTCISKRHLDAGVKIDAIEFFNWACSQKLWVVLKDVKNIPCLPVVHFIQADIKINTNAVAVGAVIPGDFKKLHSLFIELDVKCQKLEKENKSLMDDLKSCKKGLTKCIENDRKRRKNCGRRIK